MRILNKIGPNIEPCTTPDKSTVLPLKNAPGAY